MALIVVDAGVVVTALVDDGDSGRTLRDRLVDERLAAPEIVDLEVSSVLRRLAARGRLAPTRAAAAVADLTVLRLDRAPHRPLLARCWELRHQLTAYDAAYVALAERLDAVLLTADRRIVGASDRACTVENVEIVA